MRAYFLTQSPLAHPPAWCSDYQIVPSPYPHAHTHNTHTLIYSWVPNNHDTSDDEIRQFECDPRLLSFHLSMDSTRARTPCSHHYTASQVRCISYVARLWSRMFIRSRAGSGRMQFGAIGVCARTRVFYLRHNCALAESRNRAFRGRSTERIRFFFSLSEFLCLFSPSVSFSPRELKFALSLSRLGRARRQKRASKRARFFGWFNLCAQLFGGMQVHGVSFGRCDL